MDWKRFSKLLEHCHCVLSLKGLCVCLNISAFWYNLKHSRILSDPHRLHFMVLFYFVVVVFVCARSFCWICMSTHVNLMPSTNQKKKKNDSIEFLKLHSIYSVMVYRYSLVDFWIKVYLCSASSHGPSGVLTRCHVAAVWHTSAPMSGHTHTHTPNKAQQSRMNRHEWTV